MLLTNQTKTPPIRSLSDTILQMINTRPQSPTMAITTVHPTKEFQSNHAEDLGFKSVPSHNHHRRVRFSMNDENDSQSAPHKELTAEMIDDLWYTEDEITEIKNNVRSLVIRNSQHKVNDEEEMAGLEKYNPQRSEYKKAALYHILRAQSKSRDPEFLRSVSSRSTAWARTVAADQGFHDYCEIYDPLDNLLDFDNLEPMMNFNDDNSPTLHKRSHHDAEIPASSKRQRLSR